MFCLGVFIHLSNRWGSIRITWYNAANVSARVVVGSDLNSVVDLAAFRPYGFTVVTMGLPLAYSTSAVPMCVRAISNISASSSSLEVRVRTRRSFTSLVVLSPWIHARNCRETRFRSVLFTNFENRMRYCDGKREGQDGTPRHPIKTVRQDTLSRRYTKTPYQDGMSRVTYRT